MSVKDDFPIFKRRINGHPLVYLDNAATTQKPQVVLDALIDYYTNHNANVHRGNHTLSDEATNLYEAAREAVAKFINADSQEIVFVRNTTEAINLVAYSWGRRNLKAGDTIILTELEHHSNLLPWYILREELGFNIEFVRINQNGQLDLQHYQTLFKGKRVPLVSFGSVSNVLGTVTPVEELVRVAKLNGAVVLVDGAQSVPRFKTSVLKMGADFLAFSAHKMLGPTGIGVLWSHQSLLSKMPPFLSGGSMIDTVSRLEATYADIPQKFEAGTPNVADAVAFIAALKYLNDFGLENVEKVEKELLNYAVGELKKIGGVTGYGWEDLSNKTGVLSFNIKGIHAHDVSTVLDSVGVCVRSGQHCAAPLMKTLGVPATVRASFYLYNDKNDVDQMLVGIKKAKEIFNV
jgi:cysteine desulfurase/selenocysteine lyase